MKKILLRWPIYWGYLIDGIIGIATLGLYTPKLALRLAKYYAAKTCTNRHA